jgi:hypothetical protein
VKNIIATISALAARTLRADAARADVRRGLPGPAARHGRDARAAVARQLARRPLRELSKAALRSHVALDGTRRARGPEVLMAPDAARDARHGVL